MHEFPENDDNLKKVATCDLPTEAGNFKLSCYVNDNGREHLAYWVGDITSKEGPVLCRVHSECLTGDAFGSRRCDCGPQLRTAMRMIQEEGRGVIVYLRQEGRGIGLINKIRAYELQDGGMDTVDANVALGFPADARSFRPAAAILRDLGVDEVNLLTNNPEKIKTLKEHGINVARRTPIEVGLQERNRHYLETKRDRMGHLLDDEFLGEEGKK